MSKATQHRHNLDKAKRQRQQDRHQVRTKEDRKLSNTNKIN